MRAVSLLAVVLALTWSAEPQVKPAPKASTSRPDVFLITIDTLRADHVGCYGAKQVKTPNLDGIAAQGVRFTQAFTVSPITNSSHASLLTGTYPSTNGVRDFGSPLGAVPTWAETLKKNGYQTAAFIGAVILDSKALAPGLDRGFDYYDNFPEKTATKSRWGRVERRGMDVVSRAEKWLGTHRAGPHFVWVHLYDPHDPYEPPPPYSEQHKSDLYDGEIAYADAAVGHLVRFLRQQGWYDGALVVVVADHGEGLGEHGEDTHGIFLYDSTTHIPLIMKLPGAARANSVDEAQVRSIDLLPTVADLLNVQIDQKVEGKSFKAQLLGSEGKDQPALAETEYPVRFGWAPLRAARASGFKFIEAPQPELYDLNKDPAETHNIYEPWSSNLQQLRAMVAALPPITTASKGAVGEDTNAELKALGYFPETRGETTVSEPSLLPDPKDKIEIQNLIHKADLAIEDGRAAEARTALLRAVELDPSSAPALSELGQLEIKTANYTQAAEHLRRAAELRPTDATALYYLGIARTHTDDLPGAAEALEQSLKLFPGRFDARVLLGEVYTRRGELTKAADQLEAATLMQTSNADSRVQLGRVLEANHQYAAAARQFEEASRLRPRDGEIYALLEKAYREAGNEAGARKAAAQAARLSSAKGPKVSP